MTSRSDTGMTLFELVVAMALFAMIATMGVQAMTGSLSSRDRLDDSHDRTQALAQTLALLRRDLAQAVPAFFAPPGGGLRSALDIQTDRLALSVSGQPRFDAPGAADLHRIVWTRAPDGTLSRHHWPTLTPARTDQQAAPMPHLAQVTALGIDLFDSDRGWIAAAEFLPEGGVSSDLPDAVRVILDLRDFGPVTLVQALP